MTIVFAKQGDCFIPTEDITQIFYEKIPNGTYTISFDMKLGYFVKEIDNFKLPKKLYGFITGRSDRIIKTFFDRPSSTGVILSGEKGSGKTLLAKKVSLDLAKEDVITLIVDQSHHGSLFNQFIQQIQQPALVIFDEYEKVYNHEEHQNALLTLFDGVYPSKKLFMVTTNERSRMNNYMINRPGRFFYAFEYKGVDEASIREYLEDHLKNKEHTESFVRYASTYESFNFDMLTALVEEMNRYNESVTEAAKYVNVVQSYGNRFNYRIKNLVPRGEFAHKFKRAYADANYGSSFNPYVHEFQAGYYIDETDEDGEVYEDEVAISFSPFDIKSLSNGLNKISYENEKGFVEIERIEKESFDINKYL